MKKIYQFNVNNCSTVLLKNKHVARGYKKYLDEHKIIYKRAIYYEY